MNVRFPSRRCCTPALSFTSRAGGRVRRRRLILTRSRRWATELMALFGWLESGTPSTETSITEAVSRAISRGFNVCTFTFHSKLANELREFCCTPLHKSVIGRGWNRLHQIITHMASISYESKHVQAQSPDISTAIAVKAERISLPLEVGQVSVSTLLAHTPYLKEFLSMPMTVPEPGPVLPGGPRACHRLAPGNRVKIIRRLANTKVAIFAPKAECIRGTLGNVICGGLFCCSTQARF